MLLVPFTLRLPLTAASHLLTVHGRMVGARAGRARGSDLVRETVIR